MHVKGGNNACVDKQVTVLWVVGGGREVRLRQLLGTRYDSRKAEADWAWHMRLAFRIQQLQTSEREAEGRKEQGEGRTALSTGWGREFLTWREDGRALVLGAEATPTLSNTSLASGDFYFCR